MFKSRFAREMVQFNSLTEEVLCGGYYSPSFIQEEGAVEQGLGVENQMVDEEGEVLEEEEWMRAEDFKRILDRSEDMDRNLKLWRSGPAPPPELADADSFHTACTTPATTPCRLPEELPLPQLSGGLDSKSSDREEREENKPEKYVTVSDLASGPGRKSEVSVESSGGLRVARLSDFGPTNRRSVSTFGRHGANSVAADDPFHPTHGIEGGSQRTEFPLGGETDAPRTRSRPASTIPSPEWRAVSPPAASQQGQRATSSASGTPVPARRRSSGLSVFGGGGGCTSNSFAFRTGKIPPVNGRLSALSPGDSSSSPLPGHASSHTSSHASWSSSTMSPTPTPRLRQRSTPNRSDQLSVCSSPRSEISRVETVVSLGKKQQQQQQEGGAAPWNRNTITVEVLEEEVRRLREENSRLVEDTDSAREGYVRYKSLEKELVDLRWQIARMEDSRKVYESATQQLVTFLDLVTDQLAGTTSGGSRSRSRGGSTLNIASSGRQGSTWDVSGSRLSLSGVPQLAGSRLNLAQLANAYDLIAGNASLTTAGDRLSRRDRLSGGVGGLSRLSLGTGLEINNRLRSYSRPGRLSLAASDLTSCCAEDLLGSSRLSLASSGLAQRDKARAGVDVREGVRGRERMRRSRSSVGLTGVVSDDETTLGPKPVPSGRNIHSNSALLTSHHKNPPALPLSSAPRRPHSAVVRRLNTEDDPLLDEIEDDDVRLGLLLRGGGAAGDGGSGRDCAASLESKDSGRSTEDSASSGRCSPKDEPRNGLRSEDGGSVKERQQLTSKARSMVKAVRHFLAREKKKGFGGEAAKKPDSRAGEEAGAGTGGRKGREATTSHTESDRGESCDSPWTLQTKQQKTLTDLLRMEGRVNRNPLYSEDECLDDPMDNCVSSTGNRVVISINPPNQTSSLGHVSSGHFPAKHVESAPGVKRQSSNSENQPGRERRQSGCSNTNSPKKSYSFNHSTPRSRKTSCSSTGTNNYRDNLIKITKMGTVSVPVPFPITPLKTAEISGQQWF